jgi:hypothetical protein
MNKATAQFDFIVGTAKARKMTTANIHGALVDIRETLCFSDALDREYGGNRGGYYRDEAHTLMAELTRRNLKKNLDN